MKVHVDRGRCIGNGLCAAISPDVFELDNDGTLVVKPADGEIREAQPSLFDAIASCPAGAISTDEASDY